MALSKVDLENQVENQLPQNLVANNLPFRNIIINGDMSIAQRGTSTSSITSDGYYTVDRFNLDLDTLGTWTQSQSTDVPSGQGFAKSLKMDCTTADGSPSVNDKLVIAQAIEGQNLQYLKKGTSSAESLTLSFWVKTNKTGTYTLEILDNDNTRSFSQTYTVSSADTWEKKTITYTGDTTGAFDNDNGSSLQCNFWLGAGSNFTSGTFQNSWGAKVKANRVSSSQVNLADSTSNEWYMTGVQLEAGETASDFEFLPYDINFLRCQRYFQVLEYFVGYSLTSTTIVNGQAGFSTMRSAPSISSTGVISVTDDVTNAFTQSSEDIIIASNGSTTKSANVQIRNMSGLTLRRNYSVLPNSSGKPTLDSEL
jgi:hypothetical protein